MKIKKYFPMILLITLFIFTLVINSQIGLFGDDYYYATFIRGNFLELHKQHYLEINGRAIVHFLDSIFLALPKFFWAILNSLMLTGITYFGSKIVSLFSNSKNAFTKSIIIFSFGILALNILVTRQSIYWITGSFNYVYPIFMLFLYWYILLKDSKTNFENKKLLRTSILAFWASATVEQGGMMAFGCTTLLFLYFFIDNKKNNESHNLKRLSIILLCSFIGIISVICSPAQFIRFGLETDESFSRLTSAKECIKFLIVTFSSKYLPQTILALLAVLILFITRKNIEEFSNEQIYLIISTIILGIGSQIMMLVSPVYGERNTLFGIFMVILFTAILISKLPEYNNKINKFLSKAFYLILVIFSIASVTKTFINYKKTNEIQSENIKLINEYKTSKANEPLILYKLIDDKYSWSMPYVSPYHEHWFKIYYDIPNAEIIWHEYKNG